MTGHGSYKPAEDRHHVSRDIDRSTTPGIASPRSSIFVLYIRDVPGQPHSNGDFEHEITEQELDDYDLTRFNRESRTGQERDKPQSHLVFVAFRRTYVQVARR